MTPAELAAAAEPSVYWSAQPGAPADRTPLTGTTSTDLCIVGGGFTGLWAAIQAALFFWAQAARVLKLVPAVRCVRLSPCGV